MTNNTISLNQVGLHKRAINALNRAGITTLNQVKDLSESDLAKVRDLGHQSFRAVRNAIKEYLPCADNEIIITKEDAKTIFKGINQLGTNLHCLLNMANINEESKKMTKEVIILISAVSADILQLNKEEMEEVLNSVSQQLQNACQSVGESI